MVLKSADLVHSFIKNIEKKNRLQTNIQIENSISST